MEHLDKNPPQHTGASLLQLLNQYLGGEPEQTPVVVTLDGAEGTFTADIKRVMEPESNAIDDTVLVDGTYRVGENEAPARLTLAAGDEITPLSVAHLSFLPSEAV